MPVSNKERQARHRARHPERELTRQRSKRARTVGGKVRNKGKCVDAWKGGCAGPLQFDHGGKYEPAKSGRGSVRCHKHHEQAKHDQQK